MARPNSSGIADVVGAVATVVQMTLHRRQPEVGMRVTVAGLATRRPATIEDVAEDGRRLLVVTDDGDALVFALSRASGRFMEGGSQTGARLLFDDALL